MIESLKLNWGLYVFVFVFSLSVHIALFVKVGPCPSTDYKVRYAPQAIQIVEWLKGNSGAPQVKGYDIFHLTYTIIVSFFTLFFEQRVLIALIIFQTIVSFPLFLFILYISLQHYHSKLLAVAWTCLSCSFFDNIHWTTWAVPDSVFRVLFVLSYVILLKLYFAERYYRFLIILVASSVLLVFTRIDSIILLSPVYFLGIKILLSHWQKTRGFVLSLLLVFLLALTLFSKHITPAIGVVVDLYWEGFVVLGIDEQIPGLTTIGVFDYRQIDNWQYILSRAVHLFALRIYNFVNIIRPLWSTNHQIYFAAHMFVFYLGTLWAFRRVWTRKDKYFVMYFYVYLATMILHGVTFVDSSLRIAYTGQLFLILFSGYGVDGFLERWHAKKVP